MKHILALILSAMAFNSHAANPSPISNVIGLNTATSSERSATFYLSGDGQATPMRYKAEVFKWTGKGIEPTKDIAVFPSVQLVQPNGKYAFKVLSKIPRTEIEQTYRVIFTVLENNDSTKEGEVAITQNYSLPIFIAPTAAPFTKIEKVKVGNKWIFKNTGNSTYKTNGYTKDGQFQSSLVYIFPNEQYEVEGNEITLGTELAKN